MSPGDDIVVKESGETGKIIGVCDDDLFRVRMSDGRKILLDSAEIKPKATS